MTVTIYALKDPRNGAVRYVGATKNPRLRELAHRSARGSNRSRRAWVAELLKAGCSPMFVALESCAESDAARAEQSWIERFRSEGAALFNASVTYIPFRRSRCHRMPAAMVRAKRLGIPVTDAELEAVHQAADARGVAATDYIKARVPELRAGMPPALVTQALGDDDE